MRTVNIGDLKNQLSAYLQYVRNGEEVIIRDRQIPIARILPIPVDDLTESERELVAAGILKLPEKPLDQKAFWAGRSGNLSREAIFQVVAEDRSEDR
jgi:antitoxin (DNA-binding transcriptional repressor) of toxin-antitoxin stability system